MQHFKFVNWWIEEFVVLFFDVTNRLVFGENNECVLLNYNFVSYSNCIFFQFLMWRPHKQFRNHSKRIFVNLICTMETVWIQWNSQALKLTNLTESHIMIRNPIESHQVQIWPVVGKSSRKSISKYFLPKHSNDY